MLYIAVNPKTDNVIELRLARVEPVTPDIRKITDISRLITCNTLVLLRSATSIYQ